MNGKKCFKNFLSKKQKHAQHRVRANNMIWWNQVNEKSTR